MIKAWMKQPDKIVSGDVFTKNRYIHNLGVLLLANYRGERERTVFFPICITVNFQTIL